MAEIRYIALHIHTMKKLTIILLLLPLGLFGQNLIPNGDFELGPDSSSAGWAIGYPWDSTGNGCDPQSFVNGPDDWQIVSSSPDRMVESNMPICNWDIDTAASGKAWIDFGYNGGG